ncbi:MAG: ABC transporter substrate-binding protein [Lachnospiraceae bacterium]|nr:ABC transporter substrate-binding protein [Lachnospiraceae bacterium]
MKGKYSRICAGVLLLTAAGLSLTGCGGGQWETGERLQQAGGEQEAQMPPETDGTGKDGDDLIVVGLSQLGSESDWRIANTESYRSTLTAENGYYLLFENGQQKQENQIKALRNFILQGVDYIVVAPIVETGWDSVLQDARDAGIPVILADRMVSVEDDDLYTCYVGGNFVKESEDAGRWLADYLRQQGREEEEINIVTLQGTLGASAELGRTEGFGNVLKEHPNWHMLEIKSGDFTQAKGQEVMEYFLETYEDIDVVISQNDNMAFGAIDAIRAAGKTCGPDGEIIIISFDAVSAAFDCMLQGTINADFECNPLHGPLVDQIIKDLEAGKSVDKIQYVEETYFDTAMDLEKIKEGRMY